MSGKLPDWGNELPTVPERYSVVREIGRGSHGVVYQARDRLIPSVSVALKLYKRSLLVEQGHLQFVLDELESLSKVDHQNVVALYDVIDTEEYVGFSMEYVDGTNLRAAIEGDTLGDLQSRMVLLLQLCGGLQVLHQRNIIHRDVKPENIFLKPGESVKIGDLGIAAPRELTGDGGSPLTEIEVIRASEMGVKTFQGVCNNAVGTFGYMAPEVMLGDPYDQRVDVYSFGVIVYEVLTGRHPFRINEMSPFQSVKLQLSGKFDSLEKVAPAVPKEVSTAVMHLLAAEPRLRPTSLAAVRAVLSDSLYRRSAEKQITRSELIPGPSRLKQFLSELYRRLNTPR